MYLTTKSEKKLTDKYTLLLIYQFARIVITNARDWVAETTEIHFIMVGWARSTR
jgi:hypothetical protein